MDTLVNACQLRNHGGLTLHLRNDTTEHEPPVVLKLDEMVAALKLWLVSWVLLIMRNITLQDEDGTVLTPHKLPDVADADIPNIVTWNGNIFGRVNSKDEEIIYQREPHLSLPLEVDQTTP